MREKDRKNTLSADQSRGMCSYKQKINIRWQLVIYDIAIFLLLDFLLISWNQSKNLLSLQIILMQSVISFVCIFSARLLGNIYRQIWRYGGILGYIRLLCADGCALIVNVLVTCFVLAERMPLSTVLFLNCLNLLCALTMRMMYQYACKCRNSTTYWGRFLNLLLCVVAGSEFRGKEDRCHTKLNVAIVGAGSIGVVLAEELQTNKHSLYTPVCFVDANKRKANRSIHGIPVLLGDDSVYGCLHDMGVRNVVFAISDFGDMSKKDVYDRYVKEGFKVKVYDFPIMQNTNGKRHIRDFDIEELLFRKPIILHNEKTNAYYKDKVILITGGGGSIGSELCRQLAKIQPRQIIITDIYENGAYDLQQELKSLYGDKLDLVLVIVSITNRRGMEKVFSTYRPQIVIHAAAHKHVPLMEQNCIEAVVNNVFGTEVLIQLSEQYGVERFLMVSSDKAVNPTNVMGATKRMCEMLVLSAGTHGKVKYSATRFGNVLGSAGSVVPLFAKQIASGGPITLTDKRIIRYFMTIPEAALLVLESGAMAQNGELFVLDMGKPIRIEELAHAMIELSGAHDIDIVEIGLRPGEKLYEELLVRPDELEKTENTLIFVEREEPLSQEEVERKMTDLRDACATGNDEAVREALQAVVPTYQRVNQ